MNARELKKLEQKCAEFTQKRDAKLLKSLQEKLDKAHKIAESFPPSKIRKGTCSRKQPPEVCQQLCKCNCVYGLALLIKSGYSISISEKIKYIITKGEPMEENKNEIVMSNSEVIVLSERQSRAVTLDTTIKTRVKIIGDNLYALCQELKEMRDGKLYQEIGYQNFEEYCENEVHISRQYAYDHIGVIENLPEDFVKTSLQNGGAKNKLMLIAKASEPVRTQIMQEDPELKESYRKMKARCKELEDNQKQSESRISELESENQKSAQALDEVTADKNQIQSEFEEFREGANRRQQMLMTNLQKRKTHEEELEAQLEELENRPRDTVFEKDPAILEENAKLKTENQELKTKLSEQPAVQEMLPCDGESFSERRAEFNAYLKALSDAMNHICAFIAKYQENHRISEVEKTIEKYINAMKG